MLHPDMSDPISIRAVPLDVTQLADRLPRAVVINPNQCRDGADLRENAVERRVEVAST